MRHTGTGAVKSKIHDTPSRRAFLIIDVIFLTLTTIICIFPIINVLAVSFSSSWAAAGGFVKLWPVAFTVSAYKYILKTKAFYTAFLVGVERTLLGVVIQMILTILAAYPLSKTKDKFHGRPFYTMYIIITMLFGGGLIPTYITIAKLHMLDTMWALVLPGAVNTFLIILMMNFIRQLPEEIEESAFLDGASYWDSLVRIILPLSMPSIATCILFSTVGYWNEWFQGLIFMNNPAHYPLQSYLQTVITGLNAQLMANISLADVKLMSQINNQTTRASQVFLAAVPIFIVYPFLQRYFMTGLTLGSVKG